MYGEYFAVYELLSESLTIWDIRRQVKILDGEHVGPIHNWLLSFNPGSNAIYYSIAGELKSLELDNLKKTVFATADVALPTTVMRYMELLSRCMEIVVAQ